MNRIALLLCLFALIPGAAKNAAAQEPGWYGKVFLQGEEKARNDATPIEFRPYRPFHFYGNAVRRRYHRGQLLPRPRDFVNATRALIRRR